MPPSTSGSGADPGDRVVHFSPVTPATADTTRCGAEGRASAAWLYVTCSACLASRPSRRCSR